MIILMNFDLLVTFSNLFFKKGFLNTNYKKLKSDLRGLILIKIKRFITLI